MSKKKFIPLMGLDSLTEEQKIEYKLNACEYFEIPAELSLLEFMWLDSGDGGRHLVLYAKKGATDIMRGNRGICVDSIKETIGDGFIMFTATGHDKTGRVDVAVGAADTKNRAGKALSDAIMTAQTRATRRLTLQFVGGGLLDESEVQTTTNINTTTQPLAEIAAPPQLSPNAAPGRDITQDTKAEFEAAKAKFEAIPVKSKIDRDLPTTPGKNTSTFIYDSKGMVEGDAPVLATISPEEAPKKRRRRKSSEVVFGSGSTPMKVGDAVQMSNGEVRTVVEAGPHPLSASLPEQIFSLEPPVIIAPRVEVTPAPPEPSLKVLFSLPVAKTCLTCNVPVWDEGGIYVNEDKKPHICVTPTPAPIFKDQPNEKQKKEFKDRLFNYTNNILRQGKMIPCEGIGGVEYKVRAFVRVMFPYALETKHLTVNQWETFLGYMDEKAAEVGAEGLVKIINEKIGAKE